MALVEVDLSKIGGFEWDFGNLGHIRKHNVKVKECEEVFFNKPFLLSKDEAHSIIEERFQVLGLTDRGRLVFLAFTVRKNKIRVVSARDQNKKERERFSMRGGENL